MDVNSTEIDNCTAAAQGKTLVLGNALEYIPKYLRVKGHDILNLPLCGSETKRIHVCFRHT